MPVQDIDYAALAEQARQQPAAPPPPTLAPSIFQLTPDAQAQYEQRVKQVRDQYAPTPKPAPAIDYAALADQARGEANKPGLFDVIRAGMGGGFGAHAMGPQLSPEEM